ncbi:hypothetical protein [Kiritimatiella glycovorans]|uniref:Phosphate-selective porin n=1 Tax=Kiritimatiella glycovorans TaxID=1307763 RepID=A0A0G3EG19_9BACT|nr:hypothetical protein [Kiritimatiella glycovorans]AKJ65386.1 hypothetical protein L21SP4_02158 [Kiritimatiella glycovorans]
MPMRQCLIALMTMMVAGSALAADALYAGPVRVGGAARVNYQWRDWDDTYEGGELTMDTVRLNLDLDTNNVIGSLEYRYYNGGVVFTEGLQDFDWSDGYSMLHHGWLGYRFSDQYQVQLGVHQVPFGIQPYASHNWFFQMPYYVGLEDDYDTGIKSIYQNGPWNFKLAYYIADEGHWTGNSEDSARYSYDLVNEDFNGNQEKHQGNARLTYTMEHGSNATTEIGASLQAGKIEVDVDDDDGDRYAGCLHLNGDYGRWNLQLEAIRYEYSLENANGYTMGPSTYDSGSYVMMGAYDAPYLIASKGQIYCAGLAYTLPIAWDMIDSLTFYDDYSILVKDDGAFEDSEQNVLGCMIASGRWFTYVDVASGRNQPWLGGNWDNGLASGAGTTENEWQTRFNVNVGFYF